RAQHGHDCCAPPRSLPRYTNPLPALHGWPVSLAAVAPPTPHIPRPAPHPAPPAHLHHSSGSPRPGQPPIHTFALVVAPDRLPAAQSLVAPSVQSSALGMVDNNPSAIHWESACRN